MIAEPWAEDGRLSTSDGTLRSLSDFLVLEATEAVRLPLIVGRPDDFGLIVLGGGVPSFALAITGDSFGDSCFSEGAFSDPRGDDSCFDGTAGGSAGSSTSFSKGELPFLAMNIGSPDWIGSCENGPCRRRGELDFLRRTGTLAPGGP